MAAVEDVPLGAIVIPVADRAAGSVVLSRVGSVEALVALLSFPRLLGWEDAKSQAGQFQRMADVANEVPFYTARVPWGPPFPEDLAQTVLEAGCTSVP